MLAIARALLTQPRLLLLDEPCEGLAVDLAARVRAVVAELTRTGLTVLLVEQQPEHARAVTDRLVYLANGVLGAGTERGDESTEGAARESPCCDRSSRRPQEQLQMPHVHPPPCRTGGYGNSGTPDLRPAWRC